MSGQDDEQLFFENTMPSGNHLFSQEMMGAASLLSVPSPNTGSDHRHSPSASSPSDISGYHALSISGSSSSRLPSLSPSSQPMHFTSHGHSPRSSASPSSNSNFSNSATDEFIFNSFSTSDLDSLFLADESSSEFTFPMDQLKPGQSLSLPGQMTTSNPFSGYDGNDNIDFLQNLLNGSSNIGFTNDDTFDMLNLVETPSDEKRSLSLDTSDPSSLLNFDFAQQARAIGNVGGQAQQHQQLSHQSVQPQNTNIQTGQDGWSSGMMNGVDVKQPAVHQQPVPVGHASLPNADFTFSHTIQSQAPTDPDAPRAPESKPKPRASQSKAKVADGQKEEASAGAPTVGKHNKTERRYRQKVQAAQADLRDAIPALRLLYDTSTEEQKRTTDFRLPDGTVDGLGEVTRPNASAKATILIGARMYIELLQKRSAMLQRKVNELEAFRLAVAGEDNLRQWQANFDGREREIQAAADAAAALRMEDDSLDEADEGEDEEENEPKRKKPKVAAVKEKAPRAKPGPKGKKAQAATLAQTAANGGLRVFAAFAMSFSFLPSASTVLKQTPTETSTAGQVLTSAAVGNATTGQILSRLPLITAEHASRLIARSLPATLVPAPHTLVDWVWRLLVAVVLAVSLGPIIARLTRSQDEKRKAGNVSIMAKDFAGLVSSLNGKTILRDEDEAYWTKLAAGIVGGAIKPSALEKWHVILHLHNTAVDAYPLALLALLLPEVLLLRSPQQVWHDAQSKLTADSPTPLATVLKLPLLEVHRCAESLEKTGSPIAAIAEQITLVHIYDLYSRFFIRLVDASTRSKSAATSALSTKNLLSNLESCDIGSNLKSSAFDKEIRTVIDGLARGSAAHALGLVLVGLWGIFTRPAPSAQAALASALAAEEVQGAGAGLSSISAMLELLYPGSRDVLAAKAVDRTGRAARLPSNALAIDKLATACIDYIKLLSSSVEVNESSLTRVQRLEASRRVQKDAAHLRLVLTQTKFVGMGVEYVHGHGYENDHEPGYHSDSDESDSNDERAITDVHDGLGHEGTRFEMAKESLVKVLCGVGRRAAGRANGRDEDSGFEGDLDDL